MSEFLSDLKAMCGALLHSVWQIEQSGNPNEIPIDLAHEILSYLKKLREYEDSLSQDVAALLLPESRAIEAPNTQNGNNENDPTNEPPKLVEEKLPVVEEVALNGDAIEQERLDMVDETANEDKNTGDSTEEATVNHNAEEAIVDHNVEEEPQNSGDTASDRNRRNIELVTNAIQQLERHQNGVAEQPKNHDTEIGIQAEVIVTTTQDAKKVDAEKRLKRKACPKQESEEFIKRRYSMDMRIFTHSDVSSSNEDIAPIKVKNPDQLKIDNPINPKLARAMKKRHSSTRKTICVSRMQLAEDEDDPVVVYRQNTDQKMHAANDKARKWCVICKKPQKHLVAHYIKMHAEYEIPISRPSPQHADQLRQQRHKFTHAKSMINGICLFCDEMKSLAKNRWADHYLLHTGEKDKKFICFTCDKLFRTQSDNDHKQMCEGELINICFGKAGHAVSGYMCNDCNYLQFHRGNMIKHLKNEHGYVGPEEKCQYNRFVLVADRIKEDTGKSGKRGN